MRIAEKTKKIVKHNVLLIIKSGEVGQSGNLELKITNSTLPAILAA